MMLINKITVLERKALLL